VRLCKGHTRSLFYGSRAHRQKRRCECPTGAPVGHFLFRPRPALAEHLSSATLVSTES